MRVMCFRAVLASFIGASVGTVGEKRYRVLGSTNQAQRALRAGDFFTVGDLEIWLSARPRRATRQCRGWPAPSRRPRRPWFYEGRGDLADRPRRTSGRTTTPPPWSP